MSDCRVMSRPKGAGQFRIELDKYSCSYRILELCTDGYWWGVELQDFKSFGSAEKALRDYERYLKTHPEDNE